MRHFVLMAVSFVLRLTVDNDRGSSNQHPCQCKLFDRVNFHPCSPGNAWGCMCSRGLCDTWMLEETIPSRTVHIFLGGIYELLLLRCRHFFDAFPPTDR